MKKFWSGVLAAALVATSGGIDVRAEINEEINEDIVYEESSTEDEFSDSLMDEDSFDDSLSDFDYIDGASEEVVDYDESLDWLFNDDLIKIEYLDDDESDWRAESYDLDSEATEVFSRSWSMYSSNYCFTKFSEAEKEFYNRLDEVVLLYMNSDADAFFREKDQNYYLKGAVYSDLELTKKRATELAIVYMYQNPQYYFINKWILTGSDDISLGCFADFADGDDRIDMTDKLFAKVDSWIAEVDKVNGDFKQVLKINDIVCDNIVYKHNSYDQSLYSAVMLGETVCAGYAKLFSVISNAIGIDSIGVISDIHAWNKVKVNDAWYNVDTTWNDDYSSKTYLCRSDEFFLKNSEHIPRSLYDGLLPEAPVDHVNISANLIGSGFYEAINDNEKVVIGMVTYATPGADVEYSWYVLSNNGEKTLISDWSDSEWLWWYPDNFGTFDLECRARIVGNDKSMVTMSTTVDFHPNIKGICQMPYDGNGGGFLIGVESYDNPEQKYSYELLILDCTLLAKGEDAWIYTTNKRKVSEGNAFWTIWQPKYGYYWTLFRVFDEEENLIDEKCYGFVNT